MRLRCQLLAAAAVLALGPAGSAGRAESGGVLPPPIDGARLTAGEPFPDVLLPTLDGAPLSIREFRGEKVILHVFASW